MRIIKLSSSFYESHKECREILHKTARPYLCLEIIFDGIPYAIPLRHHIHHQYCFRTTDEAGLDFSKSIPLHDKSFISEDDARIDTKEWVIIKRNEKKIISLFKKYINQYRKAALHPEIQRNKNILQYSSLQYFEI